MSDTAQFKDSPNKSSDQSETIAHNFPIPLSRITETEESKMSTRMLQMHEKKSSNRVREDSTVSLDQGQESAVNPTKMGIQ